jgi:nucleoside-diphosphate-sugar epimerase
VKNYLILGGHGFLGSELKSKLQNSEIPALFYNRSDNSVTDTYSGVTITFDDYLSSQKYFNVINLLAAWGNETDDSSLKYANFDLPLNLFNKITSTGKELFWVQMNSYFYFYFLETGVDKDKYSFWKRSLSETLKDQLKIKKDKLSILEIYLPHLYGENDKNNRLIKALTTENSDSDVIKLSSGLQILPILNVQDCARGLIELLSNNNSQLKYMQIYIKEQEQLSIKEIVKIIQSYKKVSVQYGVLPERKYEFYSPIKTSINQYTVDKLITFEQYLISIYEKGADG